MGHRNSFNMSQIFETEDDQRWNHPEQPPLPFARAGAPESSNLVYPVDSMSIDGTHHPAQGSHASRPSGYSSSNPNMEIPHCQPQVQGPLHDPFLHSGTGGGFHMIHESYPHQASSSSHGGQTYHGVDGGLVDLTMGSGRGPYKRKSPSIPAGGESGSTSRYFDAGSSSDLPSDSWHEKQNPDSHYTSWGLHPSYRGRAHTTSTPPHHSNSSRTSTDYCSSVNYLAPSSNSSAREWNHAVMPPAAAHGRNFPPDTSFYCYDMNHYDMVTGNISTSLEMGNYHNDFNPNRSSLPQHLPGNLQSSRGVRSSYNQRSSPAFRASSSYLRHGHVGTSDDASQMFAEGYSSRHSRPLSTLGLRSSDRNGRARVSSDRYRSLAGDAGFREQLASEGVILPDRSTYYGSRSMFDQHRDMRLDIDDMGYEELLALGERIGHVNTGLSEELISKCLTESIYCSSDQIHEEGNCVICLEEYVNMDDVGTLKSCSHDFHVGCIRKWLSMKNVCPICKKTAFDDDDMKEK
ncbi:probable E3 ubiquitin-protein ligase ZFP1 isoform X2 [Lycium barbarum]|uniref:probable E3 ubiquitin-protein ligase ZFP1 isoform X2 n=1 Tax=Lycium barbarum TaxID=112863 RepID=UPI00293E9482|nr:probable E3 ubiquitin-protein ligase ZFP1 isoform X2 [Lycium barbarum]